MVIEVITMSERKDNEQESGTLNPQKSSYTFPLTLKKMYKRKWVYPAIYVMAASVILTFMWVMRDSPVNLTKEETTTKTTPFHELKENTDFNPEAVAVNATPQTIRWPVENKEDITIVVPYYEHNSSNESRQSALVEYKDLLTPHVGIDFRDKDQKRFNVHAVLDGTVSLVQQNPVTGQRIEITHPNGIKSIYQSVSDIEVVKGDEVKQGEIIAKAGRNELEKDQGVHLHFELRQQDDGKTVNPETMLKK
jgi:stage II sporulation protein Q